MADADADGNGLISKSEMPELLKGLELRGEITRGSSLSIIYNSPSITINPKLIDGKHPIIDFCRFLPSKPSWHLGQNWNIAEVWDMIPGMSTLSWRLCHGHRATTSLFFVWRTWLQYRTSEYQWFLHTVSQQKRDIVTIFWANPDHSMTTPAGSAQSWFGGGARAWAWSGVGFLRGFSVLLDVISNSLTIGLSLSLSLYLYVL